MGLTYNSNQKKWDLQNERTDYETRPYSDQLKVWAKTKTTSYPVKGQNYYQTYFDSYAVSPDSPGKDWSELGSLPLNYSNDDLLRIAGFTGLFSLDTLKEVVSSAANTYKYNKQLNDYNAKLKAVNTQKNNFYQNVLNIINTTKQGSYNYLDAKQAILNQKTNLTNAGLSDEEAQKLIDNMVGPTGQFRNFYSLERITPWDPSNLPANLSNTTRQRTDLTENFNKYSDGRSGYYINETLQGRAAAARWSEAIAKDDLDIISRYGSVEAYAKQDYLNQITDPTKNTAQLNSIRGSESRPLSPLVTDYREQVFPDAIAQQTRDDVQKKIFGLKPSTTGAGYEFRDINKELSDFVSFDQTANKLWTQAKNEASLAKLTGATTPGPWSRLTKSLGVNSTFLTDQDQFSSLLGRITTLNPNDPNDKKIIDDNQQLINSLSSLKSNEIFKELSSYAPEINDAFTKSVQASEEEQTRKFGELRQSALRDTIEALTAAKRQELNLSLLKSTSVGQEISSLQQTISDSLLGDLSIGGMMPKIGDTQTTKKGLDFGLSDVFGTKNGLIYNWENWFNNEIEKKYAGDIDIPNDYVPAGSRTFSNGFIDDKTAQEWKKYDDAYKVLKTSPFDPTAKALVDLRPSNYVPVEDRKTVKQEWLDYENQLKAKGYVDAKTLASWAQYDKAYADLQKDPSDTAAKAIYDKRPVDYIPPEKRMDKDVQFAKEFFSTYLKPRFDASQSIAEFQDYINVTKDTQNPFQTQDRLNALKLTAQTSVSNWFASLQKAGDSRFNSDYYFDPINYLKSNGVGDPNNPLLPGAAFLNYADTVPGQNALRQNQKVTADWEAAKRGDSTTDDYGATINWLQQAYNYGIDVNNKAAFAKLHYQLVGQNAPEKDADGNIVRKPDGSPSIQGYDPAPDVYAPQIAKLYISQILTPYLIDQSNKIGSVFGQFIKPSDYVDEVLKAVNLPQNKDQWSTILEKYGIDPNASLNEIKDTLVDSLSQDSTTNIKKQIGDFLTENKGQLPTQSDIGVEYIQRDTAPSGTVTEASGVYAVFKNAGFSGTEKEFYSTFMPDASQQDIDIMNAAYAPAGKTTPLLPTVTGTGMEQIATMADLFGDKDISEVLSTAGVSVTKAKPSLLAQFITASGEGEDVGIGDPFADTDATFGTTSGTTQKTDQMGIGNPFDDVGINDPFSDPSDPFTSSSDPFNKTSSSVVKPTIVTFAGTPSLSKKSLGFSSSLFEGFGAGFGF